MPPVDGNDHKAHAPVGTPQQRLVAAAHALLVYREQTGRVHYTQSSLRMTIVRHHLKPPFHDVIYEDCSSSVTGYYWIAGLPDPNGLGYNGQGYTGTLCKHGKKVKDAHIGDLVFYGSPPTFEHVVIAVGNGQAISHGHEGGPVLTPINYRPPTEIRRYV